MVFRANKYFSFTVLLFFLLNIFFALWISASVSLSAPSQTTTSIVSTTTSSPPSAPPSPALALNPLPLAPVSKPTPVLPKAKKETTSPLLPSSRVAKAVEETMSVEEKKKRGEKKELGYFGQFSKNLGWSCKIQNSGPLLQNLKTNGFFVQKA